MKLNTIYNEDCLVGMKRIPSKSVDMILCDLPYGTTQNKWDSVIPFEPLWEQYERIIKDNGAIVLTAAQPFTSTVVMSNPKLFRYEWIWEKTMAANFMHLKRQPAKRHENMLVFYKKQPTYNPQMIEGEPYIDKRRRRNQDSGTYGKIDIKPNTVKSEGLRYPKSVVNFSNGNNKNTHPTQKPVALFEYLIKTYTNKGETVLDNCMGSGTTAIACLNTDRQYIGFELDETYHKLSLERIENHTQQLSLI